jgi:hypothetical protein
MQVHGRLVETTFGYDLMSSNDLMAMYGISARVDVSSDLFAEVRVRNIVSVIGRQKDFSVKCPCQV